MGGENISQAALRRIVRARGEPEFSLIHSPDARRFPIAGWSGQLYRLRQALIDLRALAPVFHSLYTMALPRYTIALERHGPL